MLSHLHIHFKSLYYCEHYQLPLILNALLHFASLKSEIHVMGKLINILNKSENTTLQLSIFYEKVLGKKYLLKLNNVAQTSSKRFVETPPICLV